MAPDPRRREHMLVAPAVVAALRLRATGMPKDCSVMKAWLAWPGELIYWIERLALAAQAAR